MSNYLTSNDPEKLDIIEDFPGVDHLGRGYNIFGGYADSDSTMLKLFNLGEKELKKLPNGKTYWVPKSVDYSELEESKSVFNQGSTLYEYQRSLNVSTKIQSERGFFSGALQAQFGQNISGQTKKIFSSRKDSIRKGRLRLPDWNGIGILLKPEVKADLEKLEPRKIFEKYGTHYVWSLIIGGCSTYSSVTDTSRFTSDFSLDLVASMAYNSLVGNVSASINSKFQEDVTSFKENSISTVNVIGGRSEFAANILDGDYQAWLTTINENPVFSDFEDPAIDDEITSLRPIWELCENEITRKSLECYFHEYVNVKSHNPNLEGFVWSGWSTLQKNVLDIAVILHKKEEKLWLFAIDKNREKILYTKQCSDKPEKWEEWKEIKWKNDKWPNFLQIALTENNDGSICVYVINDKDDKHTSEISYATQPLDGSDEWKWDVVDTLERLTQMALIKDEQGIQYVFAISVDGNVWCTTFTDHWTPSINLDHAESGMAALAVGQSFDDHLVVFGLTTNNILYRKNLDPSEKWISIVKTDDVITSCYPIRDQSKRLMVFVSSKKNTTYLTESDGWIQFHPIGLQSSAMSVAAKDQDDCLELFMIGYNNNKAYRNKQKFSGSNEWMDAYHPLEGSLSKITVINDSNGAQMLFGIGTDKEIWCNRQYRL